jgi:hypothetical protein
MSACNISFFDLLVLPYTFFGDVRREFMQRLSTAFHDALGSYLRDALQEGSANAMTCLPVLRAWVYRVTSSLLVFALWLSSFFLCHFFVN